MAVEAIPEKVAFLRRKFPDVDIRSMALSSDTGKTIFYIDSEGSGYSSMTKHRDGDHVVITVPMARLDDIVSTSVRYDFIKIDVEGAELLVLQGARESIGRDRPLILFECTPFAMKPFGAEPADLYRFFTRELDYRVYFLKDWLDKRDPVTIENFEQALVYPFTAFKWVAMPPDPPSKTGT